MWFALSFIAIILGGLLAIAGAGIYAVPLALLLLGGALFLFMKQAKETGGDPPATARDETPADTGSDGTYQRLGPAYEGQDTMVPESQK